MTTASTARHTPTGNTYDKYGTTNPIEQRMMRGFMRSLDEMLGGLTPRRILEIGVGEGHVMTRSASASRASRWSGSTCPTTPSATTGGRSGLPCMFGDATTLPFPDDSFDLVLAIEVLEHVPTPDHALGELSRVVLGHVRRVGAVRADLAGRQPRARGATSRHLGNTPGHVNHWTRWGFRRFVESRFHVQQVRSPLPWTMTRAIPA